MEIDPKLILITLALVALCVPWLYDGTLFTRQRVWKRKYRTSAYSADRHGEVRGHRDPIEAEKRLRYKAWRGINSIRGERRRLSEAEQQDVRDKAHRSL